MIDFDDLDESAAAMVEAGDELSEAAKIALGATLESPGPYRGGLMPVIPRTKNIPPLEQLPERILKTMNLKDRESREVRVWLFVFYGAGDSVLAWRDLMNDAPSWLDVAVYERAGHGLREMEEQPGTLMEVADDAFNALKMAFRQVAKGGSIEGAPFAFMGHSMGAQVMLEVARKARLELGVEPSMMFILDRGAPHYPLYTQEGYEMLCEEDPLDFFDGFHPMISKLMRGTRTEASEHMISMWTKDLKLSQEHQRDIGYHILKCDLHVFLAAQNYNLDVAEEKGTLEGLPAEARRLHKLACKITNSGPKSSAPFCREAYQAWERWTAEKCTVHEMNTDHVSVKTFPQMIKTALSYLSQTQCNLKRSS